MDRLENRIQLAEKLAVSVFWILEKLLGPSDYIAAHLSGSALGPSNCIAAPLSGSALGPSNYIAAHLSGSALGVFHSLSTLRLGFQLTS